MKMRQYAEALLKLPEDFLESDYEKIPLCFFHNRLIAAHEQGIMVYNKDAWEILNDKAFKEKDHDPDNDPSSISSAMRRSDD